MDPWICWRDRLKSPKFILAPMVDHSELPWRMLSREYGCQAAFTPMFHAANFASQKKYRQKNFSTCPEDRPLIVQFCANNADILVAAAKHVETSCDGIDINLGCPQDIARRGHYGAFLQDEWNLIDEMVTRLRNNLDNNLAVSCKIRRFDCKQKTLEYSRMLEKAGCSFIGLHARTREQRGCKTGAADWSYIKTVKDGVSIPVIANGNVQSLRDATECLDLTGADAVMTAEGNLHNPCLFLDIHPPAWSVANRYLDLVEKYPIPAGMAKSHLFKLFHRCVALEDNAELRAKLGQSTTIEQLREAIDGFKTKYATEGEDCDQTLPIRMLPVPPYLCQPRFRYEASSAQTEVLETIAPADGDRILEDSSTKRIKLDE